MSSSRTLALFRVPSFNVMLGALALFLIALVAPAAAQPANASQPPDLGTCQNVQAPAGNEAAFHVYAQGVQIYRWTGTSWTFVAPDALLFADNGGNGLVGHHYAGPTWESNSGSKVIGTVLQRCTPNPSAIPWLLLQAVSSEDPGIFDGVTFIQRLNTIGGLTPTTPGASVGEEAQIAYTAEYFFYRAQD